MCRHETVTYACGHKEDLGFFCDYAQSYGPFFNKAACPNYSHGPETVDYNNQCGKEKGFYCAKSQDGVVVDKAKGAMLIARAQFDIKKTEFESITLRCTNYLQEAKTRGLPAEELAKVPDYRNLVQQRQTLGQQSTILRNRIIYFNSLINHAFRERDRLLPGMCLKPEWDCSGFDFAHSIFPPDMLQPIRHTLPGQAPSLMTPGGAHLQNAANAYQDPTHRTDDGTHATLGSSAPPAPQVKSTRRPKLNVTTTPKKQTTVTDEGSPISSDIIRGNTPEGEDSMTKAMRYREQLTDTRKKAVTDAMVLAGHSGWTPGTRPHGRSSHRRDENVELTPTRNPRASAGGKNVSSTPAKVRRSTRTQNTKPKYTEGSDNSLGSDVVSPDKSDSAWNDSPGKSDAAWVDTPTKSVASSSSPIRPTRARNNRTAQRLTGSPSSSPTQALLNSRIYDYQRRTESTISGRPTQTAPPATQFGNLFQPRTRPLQAPRNDSVNGLPIDTVPDQSMHVTYGADSSPSHGQQVPASVGAHAHGIPQSSHTPQQRTTAMQRGSNLIQEFGQNLYQHHLASGLVDTTTAGVPQSLRTQQYAAPPGKAYAPQAQMMSTMSHVVSPSVDDELRNGSPLSPVKLFNRNPNQAKAAGVAQGRSFSTGSAPLSTTASQSVGGGPMSPSHYNLHQPTTVRVDYENMRRSFSSIVDLTPQQPLLSPHSTSNVEPLKRSLPPLSPTGARKRQRLSLPGQDDAPTLTPSSSMHQLYAPAGLPADDRIDYAAQIAAIEMFEKQNMADLAALGGAPSNIDPALYAEHNTANTMATPSHMTPSAHQSIPIDPQLYQDSSTSNIVQTTEDNVNISKGEPTNSPGAQLPQAATVPAQGLSDDSSSTLSEPDWSLLNDEAF